MAFRRSIGRDGCQVPDSAGSGEPVPMRVLLLNAKDRRESRGFQDLENTPHDFSASGAARVEPVRRAGENVRVRLSRPPNPCGGVDRSYRIWGSIGGGKGVCAQAINGRMAPAVARTARRFAKVIAWAPDEAARYRSQAARRVGAPVRARPDHESAQKSKAPNAPRYRRRLSSA